MTMSARTPKYSWAPPGASRKPVYTSSKMSGTLDSEQTARSWREPPAVAASSSDSVCRTPLVSRMASLGGGALGWNDCTGLTSTAGDLPGPPADQIAATPGGDPSASDSRRGRARCRGPAARRPTSRDTRRRRHDELAARVEAGQAHRGHDRLGTAHVERHLVELRTAGRSRTMLSATTGCSGPSTGPRSCTRSRPRAIHSL